MQHSDLIFAVQKSERKLSSSLPRFLVMRDLFPSLSIARESFAWGSLSWDRGGCVCVCLEGRFCCYCFISFVFCFGLSFFVVVAL